MEIRTNLHPVFQSKTVLICKRFFKCRDNTLSHILTFHHYQQVEWTFFKTEWNKLCSLSHSVTAASFMSWMSSAPWHCRRGRESWASVFHSWGTILKWKTWKFGFEIYLLWEPSELFWVYWSHSWWRFRFWCDFRNVFFARVENCTSFHDFFSIFTIAVYSKCHLNIKPDHVHSLLVHCKAWRAYINYIVSSVCAP